MLLWLAGACLCQAGSGADLARLLGEVEIDSNACYRVRDLTLVREDLRLYLTDGHLLFTKPVQGLRTAAVFVADVDGGDAEILVLPPTKSERQSLASFTKAPNLNEHFIAAVMLFTDDTARDLLADIESRGMKQEPDSGLLLKPVWQNVVHNLTLSFQSRIVLDLMSKRRAAAGFFFGALSGRELGNFDVYNDPRNPQQIIIGQTEYRNDRQVFDVWASFESRSARKSGRTTPENEFTLADYRIEATLTPPDLSLSAVTRVKLKPATDGETIFPFDITRLMKVTSVTIDGKPAELLDRESLRSNLIRNTGNDLCLTLSPEPLRAGREYEFEFHHEGSVVRDAGNKVYAVTARGNWFPGRGSQFSAYDLTFRFPKELSLVATGELVSETVEGDWKIMKRKTATPVRFAGFNLGVFEKARVARAGNTVELYANRQLERALESKPTPPPPPQMEPFPRPGRRPATPVMPMPPAIPPRPNPVAQIQNLANEIAAGFEFMTERFGPPPLRNLTVAPLPGNFGQGFPGLIYLPTFSYLAKEDPPMARLPEALQIFFQQILVAHETAHQWWGNSVVSAGYQHDWLLESLANYTALLFMEKRHGPRSLETALEQYRTNLLAKFEGRTVESAGPIALGTRLFSSSIPGAWRTITYEKGSWILHMLRRRMGDQGFQQMLAGLARRYSHKPISTEEFRLLAAGFLPPKSPDPQLEAFFDQWVYSTGIPTLQMQYSLKGKPPALKLAGTVTQSEVAEDFSALVPVEIQFPGRIRPVTQYVRTGNEPAAFSVNLKQAPSKVVLDPGGAVLAVRK